MKNKVLRFSIITVSAIIVICFSLFLYFVLATNNISELDAAKLKKAGSLVEFYNVNNVKVELPNDVYISIEELPPLLLQAFVSIEDRNFYSHNGLDYKRIAGAAINNLRAKSFEQGASTISQQLIKNTHLSGEKTFKRKFAEARLVKKLEKKYSKEEIFEMYLNSIYFGDNCYGIGNASKYYFNKKPKELNANECAILASIIKSPNYYIKTENSDKLFDRKNLVLEMMNKYDYIDSSALESAKTEKPSLLHRNIDNFAAYINAATNEATKKLNCSKETLFTQKIKIYTHLDTELQQKANEITMNFHLNGAMQSTAHGKKYDKCIVLCSTKSCGVSVFSSNAPGIYSQKRQPASTVKPILVFAPAFEKNLIEPVSIIEDVQTDFEGFSPSNYKNMYYGKVTVREALSKSLNVPAVKIFNGLNSNYLKNYSKSIGIDIKNYNLAVSLGVVDDGLDFLQIVSAYNMLADGGRYSKASFIRKIEKNDKLIYEQSNNKIQVISSETAFVTSDILKDCAKTGTAKALGGDFDVCSKTGTQGTEKGNTDAYNICYSSNFVMLNWVGSNGELMPNSITGGSLPTENAKKFLEIIAKKYPIEAIEPQTNLKKSNIDKKALFDDGEILIADENYEKNDVVCDYLLNPHPVSERFISPKIKNINLKFEKDTLTLNFVADEKLRYELFLLEDKNRKLIKTIENKSGNISICEKIAASSEKISFELSPVFKSNNGEKRGKSYISQSFLTSYNFTPKKTVPPPKPWWEEIS